MVCVDHDRSRMTDLGGISGFGEIAIFKERSYAEGRREFKVEKLID